MNLPSPPQFSAADFPELPAPFLGILNRALRVVYEAVTRIPDEAEVLNRFVTADSSGLGAIELRNELPRQPSHVQVTLLRNDADPDVAVAWGSTWRMVGDSIRISFAGLTSSVKYRVNVRYR